MLLDDGIVDHLLDSSLSPDLRPSAGVERIETIGIDAVSRMRDLSESLSKVRRCSTRGMKYLEVGRNKSRNKQTPRQIRHLKSQREQPGDPGSEPLIWKYVGRLWRPEGGGCALFNASLFHPLVSPFR